MHHTQIKKFTNPSGIILMTCSILCKKYCILHVPTEHFDHTRSRFKSQHTTCRTYKITIIGEVKVGKFAILVESPAFAEHMDLPLRCHLLLDGIGELLVQLHVRFRRA